MEVIFIDKKIEKFLTTLTKPTIAKILRTIDLLEYFGHQLGMPHGKIVDRNLFELRIRGQQEIRLFYTFHLNRAVILHGFIKKSQKTPAKEMVIAQQKMAALDIV